MLLIGQNDWAEQEPDFRTKAFFSAKVENARFLDRAHGLLFDYMAKVKETIVQPDGTVVTALKVGGREHFVKRMRDFMIAEGMAKPGEFVGVDQKDITDIRSVARLRLIFDTNVRQAYGYGQWKQGMKQSVLRAFPAARLIRDRGVKEPRPRHQNNLGEVFLKTDTRWAEFHNAKDIGGFGVPWGPYGFNSGVTQEDVAKAEARKLGLDVDSVVPPQPAKVTDGTEASVKKMDPAIKKKLLEELRGGPKPRDPAEAAREAAANTRRIMLSRGLEGAEQRGDTSKAAKYRKAIAEIQVSGLKVRDDGEKIVLETASNAGIFPALPDDQDRPNEGFQPAEVLSGIRAIRSTEPESSGYPREIRADREIESIIAWADERSALWPKTTPQIPDELTGGEHLVEIDEATGIVFKSTHSGKFGFGADVEMVHPRGRNARPRITAGLVDATPDEYLFRLTKQNELFGDDVRVMGAAQYPQGVSVLTTQPFYKGVRTVQPVIDSWFEERGWKKLTGKDGAFYDKARDLLIMDALPRNVLTLEDGTLMPFDVVIVQPSQSLKSRLGL
jgi:hypothetical protein